MQLTIQDARPCESFEIDHCHQPACVTCGFTSVDHDRQAVRDTEADQSNGAASVVHWGFKDSDPYEGLWDASDLTGLFDQITHVTCGNTLPSDMKFISSEGPLDFDQADWDEGVRYYEEVVLQLDLT